MTDVAGTPPRVTVVIACFNAAGTIEDTIRSAVCQTVCEWELIVIDDGSHDDSVALVEKLREADPRIRLERQPNSGPSIARNRGVDFARAAVIAFLDADDLWEADHLERHLVALDADPTLGISFSPCRIIDADGALTGDHTRTWTREITLADLMGANPSATCSSLVVRRAVFEAAGKLRADMVHAEDQEWLFRAVATGWRMLGIDHATVRYRTSPAGLSADTARMLAGWRDFVGHARTIAPAVVEAAYAPALAQMRLYYARRIIRSGAGGTDARRHVAAAVRANPAILVRRPAVIAALLAASIHPRAAFALMTKTRSLVRA